MPHGHHASNDDIETLMFRRHPPAEPGPDDRCEGCPFRQDLPRRPRGGPAMQPVLPRPTLPRPALLALAEPRGSGTLVLPDAFRPAGPEAPTLERPQVDGPHLRDDLDERAPGRGLAGRERGGHGHGRAARDPGFDELASPDITVMQQASLPPRVPLPRRPDRRAASVRYYLLLNFGLGLLIALTLGLRGGCDRPGVTPAATASE